MVREIVGERAYMAYFNHSPKLMTGHALAEILLTDKKEEEKRAEKG